jgi:nucleoid-associated protein EbfC
VFPGGEPDLGALLAQAQQIQQQLAQAQQTIADARLTGTSGGGLVSATVTGSLELVSLTLAPEVVDPDDVETLVDLVLAAVRDAQRQAHELQAATMAPFDAAGNALGNLGLPG